MTHTCATSCEILTIPSLKSLIIPYPLPFLICPSSADFSFPSPSNSSYSTICLILELRFYPEIKFESFYIFVQNLSMAQILSCKIQIRYNFTLIYLSGSHCTVSCHASLSMHFFLGLSTCLVLYYRLHCTPELQTKFQCPIQQLLPPVTSNLWEKNSL